MALEVLSDCVASLIPTSIRVDQAVSGGTQQDDGSLEARPVSASARLCRSSTFSSRVVAARKPKEGLSQVASSDSQSRDSTASTYSGISDDLQGLLIPGRNVVLRFESMSAAELKVSRLFASSFTTVMDAIFHLQQAEVFLSS